jgi:hypothetical protein
VTRALFGLLPLALLAHGCSPAGALCAKQQQCQAELDLEIDDEDTRVCRVSYDAGIAALRENEEPECHAYADALLAYDSCRSALDCDDFTAPDHNGHCEGERDDVVSALADTQGECASTD